MDRRKRRKYHLKPVFLTVSKVTTMEEIDHEVGEVGGTVHVKMPRLRAQDLFKLLNNELARDSADDVNFTLDGLLK